MIDTIALAPTSLKASFLELSIGAALMHAKKRVFQSEHEVVPSFYFHFENDVEIPERIDLPGLVRRALSQVSKGELNDLEFTYAGTKDVENFICWSRAAQHVGVIATHKTNNAVECCIWGLDPQLIENRVKGVVSQFQPKRVNGHNEDLVPFTIWRKTAAGAVYDIKDIICPAKPTICQNYPAWADINWLLELSRPDERGRIAIWTGEPGTGKTTAVRVLAREWFKSSQCSVEMILDPELLFSNSDYMHSILLQSNHLNHIRDRIARRYGCRINQVEADKMLRLVVIEDGAQFFSGDCRNNPGFARLLNIADGIIGQGIRIVFLLTANETVGELDRAVVRAGRCIQVLDFPKFDSVRARIWARERGFEWKEDREATIAELYAEFNSWKTTHTEKKSFGF